MAFWTILVVTLGERLSIWADREKNLTFMAETSRLGMIRIVII